jgi:hypothetical protein
MVMDEVEKSNYFGVICFNEARQGDDFTALLWQ